MAHVIGIPSLVLMMTGCSDSGIPVTRDDPIEGEREALVTVVAFGDYQCPYTARAMKTLEALRARYSPEELRIAWKHFPLSFHRAARPAAESGAVVNALAGPEAFWKLSRRMLDADGDLAPETVNAWVGDLGVSLDAYQRLLTQGSGAEKVDADLALASSLAVRASPTLFVNGVELEGAEPAPTLIAVIDRALAQARDQIAAGVDRASLYELVTRLNRSTQSAFRAPDE